MPDPSSDASEVYGEYVKDELARQVVLKASFEQRGLSVITTSGVLVTVLFGLAALSTKKQQTFVLPTASQLLLLIALVFFVFAIGAALAVNMPMHYRQVLPQELRYAVKNRWCDDPSTARRKIAYTRIDVLEAAKRLNRIKAWIVFGAIACEFVALTVVAGAVGVVIAG